MKKSRLIGALCAVVFSLISLSSHAALLGRDLDGNLSTAEAYYDTVLGITWLGDANYAGIHMRWAAANAWAAGLTLGGATEWRLPTTVDVGNDGCSLGVNRFQGIDCGYNITTHSEMSHMFYVTLGNLAYYDTSGSGPQTDYGLTNTGPFTNLQSSGYWSATEYAPGSDYAWVFYFVIGVQDVYYKTNGNYAWAVHDGDVGASIVPVPAAVWLFGSGLLGLIGVARKTHHAA